MTASMAPISSSLYSLKCVDRLVAESTPLPCQHSFSNRFFFFSGKSNDASNAARACAKAETVSNSSLSSRSIVTLTQAERGQNERTRTHTTAKALFNSFHQTTQTDLHSHRTNDKSASAKYEAYLFKDNGISTRDWVPSDLSRSR